MKMNIKLKIIVLIATLTTIFILAGCNLCTTEKNKDTQINKKQRINQILKNSEFYNLDEKEKIEKYYNQAKTRKNEILNSKTEIIKSAKLVLGKTYTGTASPFFRLSLFNCFIVLIGVFGVKPLLKSAPLLDM